MNRVSTFLRHLILLSIFLASCEGFLTKEEKEFKIKTLKKEERSREKEEEADTENSDETDDYSLRLSTQETSYIKDNVIWENFDATEGEYMSALYFVGWYKNRYAAFVTSRESAECGGLSSDLFIQDMVTDTLKNSFELKVDCDQGYWMHGRNELKEILEDNNIILSKDPNIFINDEGRYTDIALNGKSEVYHIDIEFITATRRGFRAIATSPSGQQKVIGDGYFPNCIDYQYAGYIQSPDKSRIAVVLRAQKAINNDYSLSEPIIMGCKLDEDSF